MRALLHPSPVRTRLPGVLGLVGGYPVRVKNGGISLDLANHWTEAQAVAVNESSLRWDGIECIEADGTIIFTDKTTQALHVLTGTIIEQVHPRNAADRARLIMPFLA